MKRRLLLGLSQKVSMAIYFPVIIKTLVLLFKVKIFFLFFGEINLVPTLAGFKAVGQYFQSDMHDESRILTKCTSTKMQNLLLLSHIKCNVDRESYH